MAAVEQLDNCVEYEILYFEQGRMFRMMVDAENKDSAYEFYLGCGSILATCTLFAQIIENPPLCIIEAGLIIVIATCYRQNVLNREQ